MGTLQPVTGRHQTGRRKAYIPVVRAIPAVRARLPVPIQVHLRLSQTGGHPQCVFWDTTTHQWSKDTCSLYRANATHVTCSCYRFASYSVLSGPEKGILTTL